MNQSFINSLLGSKYFVSSLVVGVILLLATIQRADALTVNVFKKSRTNAGTSAFASQQSSGLTSLRMSTSAVSLEGYGKHVFKGSIAAPYLKKHGLPITTLDTPAWTSDGNADKVCVY